jgi:hypothetical protein
LAFLWFGLVSKSESLRKEYLARRFAQKPAIFMRTHIRNKPFWRSFSRTLLDVWLEAPNALAGKCALALASNPRMREELEEPEDLAPEILAYRLLDRYVDNVQRGVSEHPFPSSLRARNYQLRPRQHEQN